MLQALGLIVLVGEKWEEREEIKNIDIWELRECE